MTISSLISSFSSDGRWDTTARRRAFNTGGLIIQWQGGDHTELSVVKNRRGQHRWTTDVEVQALITQLARLLPDGTIASLLNRLGHRTGKGHTWTEMRVRSFRSDHHIAVYKTGEREARGELTQEYAAGALGASKMTVLRMIGAGVLQAAQACKGAPWVIKAADVQRPEVRAAVATPRRLRYQKILDNSTLIFNNVVR